MPEKTATRLLALVRQPVRFQGGQHEWNQECGTMGGFIGSDVALEVL